MRRAWWGRLRPRHLLPALVSSVAILGSVAAWTMLHTDRQGARQSGLGQGVPGFALEQLPRRSRPAIVAAEITPPPAYLLAAGIVLALVAGGSAYRLRQKAGQAKALQLLNLELERRVEEKTDALRQMVSELRTVNHTIAHDLRSPIAAILNFAAVLEEDYASRPLDALAVDMLHRIRRSALRANALLSGLSEVAATLQMELTLDVVDMSELAKARFADALRAEPDPKAVEFALDEPLPPAVGDGGMLGRALLHLFSNALKFSRGCVPRVVSVRAYEDGDQIVYGVSDTGRGFDMRFSEKVFELFERLDAKGDVEGTGVGLAVVCRIVRRHGGRVWVESREGKGTTVWFTLPRRDMQEPPG